jgi:hypothetical protein
VRGPRSDCSKGLVMSGTWCLRATHDTAQATNDTTLLSSAHQPLQGRRHHGRAAPQQRAERVPLALPVHGGARRGLRRAALPAHAGLHEGGQPYGLLQRPQGLQAQGARGGRLAGSAASTGAAQEAGVEAPPERRHHQGRQCAATLACYLRWACTLHARGGTTTEDKQCQLHCA